MLNFRKLKQDFSSTVLKEGKTLYDKQGISSARVVQLSTGRIRVHSRIKGQFDNHYEGALEIDRHESEILESNCDCPYNYDCQHLGALLFHLEEHLGKMIVEFSQETTAENAEEQELVEKIRQQENLKQDEKLQQETLKEYLLAAQLFSHSPFFLPEEKVEEDRAELGIIFTPVPSGERVLFEIQLALRLPFRSKALTVLKIKEFINAIRYHEPLELAGKRYFFTTASFDPESAQLFDVLADHLRYPADTADERLWRIGLLEREGLSLLLSKAYELAMHRDKPLGGLFEGSLETPLQFSKVEAQLQFCIHLLETPLSKIFLQPMALVEERPISLREGILLVSTRSGFIHNHTFYAFDPLIKRAHLASLGAIERMTIPEALFGTFVENVLPELQRYAKVTGLEQIEQFVTLPFAKEIRAKVALNYFNGELEASLTFCYDDFEIPAVPQFWRYEHLQHFVTEQGIVARDLVEEKRLVDLLFAEFAFDGKSGMFVAKTEKKIIEFMTEVVPKWQHRVLFDYPPSLLEQFIYDKTHFSLHFSLGEQVHLYELALKVEGELEGIKVDLLWECLNSKRGFIDFSSMKKAGKDKKGKVLIIDLEKLARLLPVFDELGIKTLETHQQSRPLWTLAGLSEDLFDGLPVSVKIDPAVGQIQKQMSGTVKMSFSPLPKDLKITLRNYQLDGVHWLERLRKMYLSGVLADDMGLGKTLQAIVAIAQKKKEAPQGKHLIICPTSLLYNWRAECLKAMPSLRVLVVDGNPQQRKKLLEDVSNYDLLLTTYSLLQKDTELYQELAFDYLILDEAQHIKNRATRNAKSVKQLKAVHRLILTGTPIENSLEDLWSLFDFLMPGLLGTYERFSEKYLRTPGGKSVEYLRRKLTPFILRRMKQEVAADLPPISHIVYYCELSPTQKELYASYAKEARQELTRLVSKEGFDRVQIHVLATLTRLKQICCHPAIFAKEKPQEGDSAKYEMLLELIHGLIEGKHKAVIFSQYTKMLALLHDDLKRQGIPFAYLDGASKNRLEVVERFNTDETIPLFLVSLKAGGVGLNITGADTVIHYDMWWNPAVENQATDRVYRLGQKKAVSSYKLITVGTIEEKIIEMQKRKKGLANQLIQADEEAMEKLTWEEVLELLQI